MPRRAGHRYGEFVFSLMTCVSPFSSIAFYPPATPICKSHQMVLRRLFRRSDSLGNRDAVSDRLNDSNLLLEKISNPREDFIDGGKSYPRGDNESPGRTMSFHPFMRIDRNPATDAISGSESFKSAGIDDLYGLNNPSLALRERP